MADFNQIFEKVMEFEGGYKLHNIPGDKGGMTYAGISRNRWPDWPGWQLIDGGEISSQRIKAMVAEFYKIHFWKSIHGDQIIFQSVAFMLYDFAVNAGLKVAVKLAQRIIGVTEDGILGPNTLKALNSYVTNEVSEKLFIAEYSLHKIFRYKDICLDDDRRKDDTVKSNLKFLCGWINRVEKGMV